MTRVRDGHELIGQAEVQVTLVEVVPVVIAVIPGAVDLVPLAVQLHGVPSMGVIGVPSLAVLNARGGQQLAVCGFVGLTGAETSGEGAFGVCSISGNLSYSSGRGASHAAIGPWRILNHRSPCCTGPLRRSHGRRLKGNSGLRPGR